MVKRKFKGIFDWYFSRQAAPFWMILILDCLLILFSGIVSYYLVYGGRQTASHFWEVLFIFIIFLPGYLLGFRIFHTYSGIIRYSSSVDLVRVACAMAVGSTIAFVIHRFLISYPSLSLYNIRALTIFLIWLISTVLCLLARVVVKFLYDSLVFSPNLQRVFVYGVHEGGEAIANAIISDKGSPYVLSGFVTDESDMVNHRMFGTRVYMLDDKLVDVMVSQGIRALFISPLKNDAIRNNPDFLNTLVSKGIKVMIQPVEKEWDGKRTLSTNLLREIEIDDLLPREKIEIDLESIGQLLREKVVLITGAAGSIGYEMVCQIAKFNPSHLVLIDHAETPMHTLRLSMNKDYPYISCETIVTSITNLTRMEQIFASFRPDYVFHAAAYKHVPMMEDNPSEAIQNNVYGTCVIADLAVKYGAKKFVMISTDKAVNPTNVMGCSKRICEIYCQSLNKAIHSDDWKELDEKERLHLLQVTGEKGITQFITTRFGNVLGSNGSVIPIFRKQIQQGGPVTVTHPDIIRYFMLIPEACRLVLEAGIMGHGGEIFVFDMGKPVHIAKLAQRMIDLSGAKGIEIKYTGLRDGEKLYEEILNDAETTRPTPHPKIMVAAVREYDYTWVLKIIDELVALSYTYDDMKVVAKMKEIVPEYRSHHSKYEVLDKNKSTRQV